MNRCSTVGLGKSRSAALTLKILDGDTIALDNSALEELRRALHGDLLVDGIPDYDAARRIWNAAIDRLVESLRGSRSASPPSRTCSAVSSYESEHPSSAGLAASWSQSRKAPEQHVS